MTPATRAREAPASACPSRGEAMLLLIRLGEAYLLRQAAAQKGQETPAPAANREAEETTPHVR